MYCDWQCKWFFCVMFKDVNVICVDEHVSIGIVVCYCVCVHASALLTGAAISGCSLIMHGLCGWVESWCAGARWHLAPNHSPALPGAANGRLRYNSSMSRCSLWNRAEHHQPQPLPTSLSYSSLCPFTSCLKSIQRLPSNLFLGICSTSGHMSQGFTNEFELSILCWMGRTQRMMIAGCDGTMMLHGVSSRGAGKNPAAGHWWFILMSGGILSPSTSGGGLRLEEWEGTGREIDSGDRGWNVKTHK